MHEIFKFDSLTLPNTDVASGHYIPAIGNFLASRDCSILHIFDLADILILGSNRF